MRGKHFLVGIGLVAAAAASAAARTPEVAGAPDTRARVDAIFRDLDRSDSPGCALGVYRDGKIVYAHGYGMANLELGIANAPHTVFDIGSTSRQFTAFSIQLLAREGKLSLDDDVRKWVPEVPSYGTRLSPAPTAAKSSTRPGGSPSWRVGSFSATGPRRPNRWRRPWPTLSPWRRWCSI